MINARFAKELLTQQGNNEMTQKELGNMKPQASLLLKNDEILVEVIDKPTQLYRIVGLGASLRVPVQRVVAMLSEKGFDISSHSTGNVLVLRPERLGMIVIEKRYDNIAAMESVTVVEKLA